MITLKQFLKPDWRKVWVFILIIIITVFSFVLSIISISPIAISEQYNIVKEIDAFIRNSAKNILTFLFWPMMFLNEENIFLEIVWLYLLSCVVVWIYDKFKSLKIKK